MFKLQPNPTFWSTVIIPVPGQEEGAAIEVEFRHKTKSGFAAFIDPAKAKGVKPVAAAKADLADMMEIINDWKGVDAVFSEQHLASLLDNYPHAARSIFTAYMDALTGARIKN